jgi:hypothetical protein
MQRTYAFELIQDFRNLRRYRRDLRKMLKVPLSPRHFGSLGMRGDDDSLGIVLDVVPATADQRADPTACSQK